MSCYQCFPRIHVTSILLLGTLGGWVLPASVHADSLIGDTVQSVFQAPGFFPGENLWDGGGGANSATPIAAVVSGGVEYSVKLGAVLSANFGANDLSISISGVSIDPIGAKLVFDFTDVDWTDSAADIGGFDMVHSDFAGVIHSFGPHSLHVEIPDQSIPFDTSTVDFALISAVPEASTVAGTIAVIGCVAGAQIFRRRDARISS